MEMRLVDVRVRRERRCPDVARRLSSGEKKRSSASLGFEPQIGILQSTTRHEEPARSSSVHSASHASADVWEHVGSGLRSTATTLRGLNASVFLVLVSLTPTRRLPPTL